MRSTRRHRRTSRGSRTSATVGAGSLSRRSGLPASVRDDALGAQPVELAALLIQARAHLPHQCLEARVLAQLSERWLGLQLPHGGQCRILLAIRRLKHFDRGVAVAIEGQGDGMPAVIPDLRMSWRAHLLPHAGDYRGEQSSALCAPARSRAGCRRGRSECPEQASPPRAVRAGPLRPTGRRTAPRAARGRGRNRRWSWRACGWPRGDPSSLWANTSRVRATRKRSRPRPPTVARRSRIGSARGDTSSKLSPTSCRAACASPRLTYVRISTRRVSSSSGSSASASSPYRIPFALCPMALIRRAERRASAGAYPRWRFNTPTSNAFAPWISPRP